MVKVPDRKVETLLAAIRDSIEESIIYSDCWKAYKINNLDDADFKHYKVKHYFNFLDPETGVHTLTIEQLWGSAK